MKNCPKENTIKILDIFIKKCIKKEGLFYDNIYNIGLYTYVLWGCKEISYKKDIF